MIVIPMAGLSSRFFKAGYDKPKYMLEAHGRTLFEHSVLSFEKYFQSEPFLFIIRDTYDTPSFVSQQIKALGIKDYQVVILDRDTRGQAETVYLALQQAKNINQPLTIFNIDTFRPGFEFPAESKKGSGYLEVFQGPGEHWSFVQPATPDSDLVARTTEKERISDLCSTGLYHFTKTSDFMDAFVLYLKTPEEDWPKGELYIAPLYNLLISKGKSIHYHLIALQDVIFCGTPTEYKEFLTLETSN
ncbi:glycosyltransferase family 2 protein [Marinobacter shengliensis]|uniref:glycosyltransferase family 2 protein n=1 Tax=Marinobacter shengliensis TaxID=1389223 RepID=UPI001E5609F6|nr:glycosyltransferase family 2 protein [Marinobacter shengliensis]MCD1631091.1 glycosyltransferase family 2 protein [Marinobacter shengliensis]